MGVVDVLKIVADFEAFDAMGVDEEDPAAFVVVVVVIFVVGITVIH